MRTILLGPQRFQVTAPAALRSLGVDGPVATINSGWEEREDVVENYAIQAIPWVQYFEGSNGFHAAFWHDQFGHARSHGCVNLAPTDARWLFEFTQPNLPPGWDAVLSHDRVPGTLVRVR